MKISTKHGPFHGYGTRPEREETVKGLLENAKKAKKSTELYWQKMKRYYDGKHDISMTAGNFAAAKNLPWVPAQATDGYIHVETQIVPEIPGFEFSGRDKNDAKKAKQREKIVKYVLDNNDMEFKNSRNERMLNIYGSAVWKVAWDMEADFGEGDGDVTVLSPKHTEIYPDPSASDIDSCEYIGYAYRMPVSRAARVFKGDLEAMNEKIDDYIDKYRASTDFFDDESDSVEICEWWYRQPEGGKETIKIPSADSSDKRVKYEWNAGDVALSVLINGKEVRNIPKYWRRTSFKNFPFVIYAKLPSERGIWGKSELETIIPLIDAKDRELVFAQLNSAFSSNDIVLMEENALSDGEMLDNSPGAVWKLRPGMMGKVTRLGNMASTSQSLYAGGSYFEGLIENTLGNYEVSWGKEPTNVTTATGIALLGERTESRKKQKDIDRSAGFKRLYSLIDKTALEHYSDGKVIRIGLEEDGEVFKFGGFTKNSRHDGYIPSVDITINTGSSVANSKAFTVSALTSLISMNINADNYKLVKAYVEAIGIPQRDEICACLDEKFAPEGDGDLTAEELLSILEKSVAQDGTY